MDSHEAPDFYTMNSVITRLLMMKVLSCDLNRMIIIELGF